MELAESRPRDTEARPRHDPAWISYEEFGERFVRAAVTPERIAAAIKDIGGQGLVIGPLNLGPAAHVGAEGKLGAPKVIGRHGDAVAFDVEIPVSLSLQVKLGREVRVGVGVEIDLVIEARAADPLYIVIDIPPVSHRNVRLVFRAEGLGPARRFILEPIGKGIRRDVASKVNAILADPAAVRDRIFDVASFVDEVHAPPIDEFDHIWISYRDFGRRFIWYAVVRERVEAAVQELSGRKIDIGPMRAGPRDIAGVIAQGSVRPPRVLERDGSLVAFELLIPVAIDLVISIARDNHYQAEIDIRLQLVTRCAEPLQIVIDVAEPRPEDIEIALKSKGLSAAVVGIIGGVKAQIREAVLAVVREGLGDIEFRTVDVAAQIDAAEIEPGA